MWKAHASPLRHAGAFARATAVWLVATLVLTALFDGWSHPLRQSAPLWSWTNTGLELVREGIVLLLGAVAAVKWHRFLLLGERPRWLVPGSWSTLRRYLLVAAAALLALLLPYYAGLHSMNAVMSYMLSDLSKTLDAHQRRSDTSSRETANPQAPAPPQAAPGSATPAPDANVQPPAESHGAEEPAADSDAEGSFLADARDWFVDAVVELVPLAVLGVVVAGLSYIPNRISLGLPAVARGHVARPFARAWTLSRGNFWRLFWGGLLTTLSAPSLALLLLAPIELLVPEGEERSLLRDVVTNSIFGLVTFLAAMLWVGFLSHAYRALVGNEPDGRG